MTKETLKTFRWGTPVKYQAFWQKGSDLFTLGRYYGLDLSETLAEVKVVMENHVSTVWIPLDNLQLI